MLLTDPIYYFGTLATMKKENNWTTFEDMKGRSVATVSGFTLVPELKSVEGIGEAEARLVWDPPWTPELMSEDAKLALGMM